MTDTERHGPVPRRPAARLDRRTSDFDENQASQAKKPSKNDTPSPHRRIFCHFSLERPACAGHGPGGPTARTGPNDFGYGTAAAHLNDVPQEQRRLARCLLIENKIKKRIESAYL